MAKRANFPHRKDARREAAKSRAKARAKRTDEQQLRKLESGGHTSCKEYANLRIKLTYTTDFGG